VWRATGFMPSALNSAEPGRGNPTSSAHLPRHGSWRRRCGQPERNSRRMQKHLLPNRSPDQTRLLIAEPIVHTAPMFSREQWHGPAPSKGLIGRAKLGVGPELDERERLTCGTRPPGQLCRTPSRDSFCGGFHHGQSRARAKCKGQLTLAA
jgi:hypothetical protein